MELNSLEQAEPRYELRIAIYYGTDQQKLMSEYAVNISTGGIFIETATPLPVNTSLFVEFMLPVTGTLVTCKARVAWINAPGAKIKSSLPPGMGMQFLDLSLDNMHIIRGFINDHALRPVW